MPILKVFVAEDVIERTNYNREKRESSALPFDYPNILLHIAVSNQVQTRAGELFSVEQKSPSCDVQEMTVYLTDINL